MTTRFTSPNQGVHIIRLPLLLRVSPAACTRTPSGSARSMLRHERPGQLLSAEIMAVLMVAWSCGWILVVTRVTLRIVTCSLLPSFATGC